MELLESIKNMVLPFIEQHDCYLDDIEYVKDGNDMYLRIYIEKNEGYLDMDTCVAVSELISDKLDEVDPIKEEYILEVSSPGIERVLRKDKHLKQYIGEEIEVSLFKSINGNKQMQGILESFDSENIALKYNNETIEIPRKGISLIKTVYNWE